MTHYVGVDVGGTKCAVTVIDASGAPLARSWAEHRVGDAALLVDVVSEAVTGLLAAYEVESDDVGGYGIAVAGLVSRDRSTLARAPTLGATGLDLGPQLTARLGRRVVVVNDANAALVGHARLATAARAASTAEEVDGHEMVRLLLSLGTGIGGAIMVGDAVVLGENGFAAELGHVPVDFDDRRVCLCGATGCVEQFASGRGVAELAKLDPPPPQSQARLAAMGVEEPYSARAIVGAAETGDGWATGLLRLGGTMLGRAMATLCVVLDPGTVIVTGSFGHAAGPWLLPHAEAELRARWPYARQRPLPTLTEDVIGPYAAATGAALLARAEVEMGEGS